MFAEPTLMPRPDPPASAFALRTQLTRTLSLDEALVIAVQQNPEVQSARLRVEQAEGGLQQVRARLQPTTNLVFAANSQLLHSDGRGLGFLSRTVSASFTAPSLAFQTSWNVFSSGLVQSQLAAAEAGLQFFDLEVRRRIQQIRLEVVRSYVAMQRAESELEIGRLALASAEATLRDTSSLVLAGQLTRFERVRAEGRVLRGREQILKAESDLRVAQRALARQLNFARPTDVVAADPVRLFAPWQLGLEETLLAAYQQRVELQQALVREHQALANRDALLASQRMQVQLTASAGFNQLYSRSGSTVESSVQNLTTSDGSTRNLSVSFGVQMSMALSDGGAVAAQARQSLAEANLARLDYVQQNNTLRFEVEQSFERLRAADERIRLGKEALAQAEQALNYARLRFRAGVATQLELIDSEEELTRTRGSLLASTLDYNLAHATLRHATGIL